MLLLCGANSFSISGKFRQHDAAGKGVCLLLSRSLHKVSPSHLCGSGPQGPYRRDTESTTINYQCGPLVLEGARVHWTKNPPQHQHEWAKWKMEEAWAPAQEHDAWREHTAYIDTQITLWSASARLYDTHYTSSGDRYFTGTSPSGFVGTTTTPTPIMMNQSRRA